MIKGAYPNWGLKRGNPAAGRGISITRRYAGDGTSTLRETSTVSRELQTAQKGLHFKKFFSNLGCFLPNLADPKELISSVCLGDLAIFLNIFFKMNKPDKHKASYKLPWLPGIRWWFRECNPGVPDGKAAYLTAEPSYPHPPLFIQFSTLCTFATRQSGCLCAARLIPTGSSGSKSTGNINHQCA